MVVGSRDIGGFLHSLDSLIELKPYKKSVFFFWVTRVIFLPKMAYVAIAR